MDSFFQGIFLTQELNLGLLHCRQILYHLKHQRSPLAFTQINRNFPGHWKQPLECLQEKYFTNWSWPTFLSPSTRIHLFISLRVSHCAVVFIALLITYLHPEKLQPQIKILPSSNILSFKKSVWPLESAFISEILKVTLFQPLIYHPLP